jgi:hypothetical protein
MCKKVGWSITAADSRQQTRDDRQQTRANRKEKRDKRQEKREKRQAAYFRRADVQESFPVHNNSDVIVVLSRLHIQADLLVIEKENASMLEGERKRALRRKNTADKCEDRAQ